MITVIFCVLITQSSASFYSEFTGALGSVKSKVGKLFTDVGHDLKETVDCATFVVEEAIFDQDKIDHYYDKCKETTTMESTSVYPITDKPVAFNIILKPIETVILGGKVVEATTKPNVVIIEKDSKDIEQKLSYVEAVVNKEFSQVANATSHLQSEFQGLSKNVDEKLKTTEEEKAEVEKTLIEIKQLHLQEESDIQKNKEEIKRISDDILNRMNKSTQEFDLKIEMNDAIKDIEKSSTKAMLKEIERWKNKGVEHKKEDADKNTTESNIPRSFKELAAKISKETSTRNNFDQETATSSLRTRNLDTTTSNNFVVTSTSASSPTTSNSLTSASEPALATTEILVAPLEPKVSKTEFSTKASHFANDILTDPVIAASISTTTANATVTSIPRTVTTLSFTNSVSQSLTVSTTNAQPNTNTTVFLNESTPSTILSLISTSGDISLSTSSTEPSKEETRPANQETQSTTIASTTSSSKSSEIISDVITESAKTITTVTATSSNPTSESTANSLVTTKSAIITTTVFTTTSKEPDKQSSVMDPTTEVSSSPPESFTTYTNNISTDVTTNITEAVIQNATDIPTTGAPTEILTAGSTTSNIYRSTDVTTTTTEAVIQNTTQILTSGASTSTNGFTANDSYRSTDVITTSTEAVIQEITLALTTTSVPTTEAQPSVGDKHVTEVITTTPTYVPVPIVLSTLLPPPFSFTDKPVTEVAFTITTVQPISSNTISKEAVRPENTSPKQKVRRTNKKRRPLAQIKVHQETDPPPTLNPFSDIDNLIPKDPAAAVAEALKSFGGSIKRKTVLDNFFKTLDSDPFG